MKVVVAVLSTRRPPWGRMIDTSKATWDSVDVPGVETFYYVGEPESPLTDRVVGFPIKDSYATMGHKNLAAWEWILANRDFDFMARVNASCFVHKGRLKAFCESAPTSGLIAGGIVLSHNGEPEWLWGGHQFLMSRDVVQAVVSNKETWPHHLMDDVALSHCVKGLGFSFTRGEHACSIDHPPEGWRAVCSDGTAFMLDSWEDLGKLEKPFFFRVKQDLKRDEDEMIMQKLHDQYGPYQV